MADSTKPVVNGGDAGKLRQSWQQTKDLWGEKAQGWRWAMKAGAATGVSAAGQAKDYMAKDWQQTKTAWGQGLRFAIRSSIASFGFPRAELIFIVFGLLKFVLELVGWDKTGSTAIIISTILLGLFSLFVLQGEGFILAIGVVTYLNLYGFPFETEFLRIAIPLFLLGAFLFGTRSILAPRLLPALLIYFYDIGAYDYLITSFGLTVPETIGSYIRIIPWWIVLGLAYIDTEQYDHKAGAMFFKLAGITIISLTLVGNIVPGIGYATPALQQFQEARTQAEALQKGEHPLLSQLACAFDVQRYASVGQATATGARSFDECVKLRQAVSKCKHLAAEDLEAYDECMKVARGEKPDARVLGTIDEAQREPTSFTITKGAGFIEKIDNDGGSNFVLDVKNPRNLRLEFDLACTYNAGTQKIDGIPIHVSIEKTQPYAFTCRSAQLLPSGPGKWIVTATARGLTTTVGLHRFFAGDQKSLLEDLAKTFFGTSYAQAISSAAAQPRGPPDPVRLDFIVGQPPQNPIIEITDPQLVATVKNNGGGELLSYSRADIAMDAPHFMLGPECKLQQQGDAFVNPTFSVQGKEKLQELRFALCDLVMDEEYRFPKLPIHRYFISTITYDYRITKEFPISVFEAP